MNKSVSYKNHVFPTTSAANRHLLSNRKVFNEDGSLNRDKVSKAAADYGLDVCSVISTYKHDQKKGINDIDSKTGLRKSAKVIEVASVKKEKKAKK